MSIGRSKIDGQLHIIVFAGVIGRVSPPSRKVRGIPERPQPLTDRGFADSIAADNDIDVSEGDSLIGLKNRCIDDVEAFDPAKWIHHSAVFAGDFELVHGLPAQKDGRWIILAVVRIDLTGMLGTKPNAIRDATQFIGRKVAATPRAALCRGKNMTRPSCIFILVRVLRRTDSRAVITLRMSAAVAGA